MLKKHFKLTTGQNLRYTGKLFPGFIKGLPYMVFISKYSSYQVMVNYNGLDTIVEKYFLEQVS